MNKILALNVLFKIFGFYYKIMTEIIYESGLSLTLCSLQKLELHYPCQS